MHPNLMGCMYAHYIQGIHFMSHAGALLTRDVQGAGAVGPIDDLDTVFALYAQPQFTIFYDNCVAQGAPPSHGKKSVLDGIPKLLGWALHLHIDYTHSILSHVTRSFICFAR